MKEPKSVIAKIKLIKKALKMPFHAFYRDGDYWIFWVENEKGAHLDWSSPMIVGAVEDAMSYVRHEIEMGAIADPDGRKKEDKKDDTK